MANRRKTPHIIGGDEGRRTTSEVGHFAAFPWPRESGGDCGARRTASEGGARCGDEDTLGWGSMRIVTGLLFCFNLQNRALKALVTRVRSLIPLA
jgi:hypothetical protein